MNRAITAGQHRLRRLRHTPQRMSAAELYPRLLALDTDGLRWLAAECLVRDPDTGIFHARNARAHLVCYLITGKNYPPQPKQPKQLDDRLDGGGRPKGRAVRVDRRRHPWTSTEDALLRLMWRLGRRENMCRRSLGRSFSEVSVRARQLSLDDDARTRHDEQIERLHLAGRSHGEIAEALGVGVWTVKRRIVHLRETGRLPSHIVTIRRADGSRDAPFTPDEDAALVDGYLRKDMTTRELADQLGRGVSSVSARKDRLISAGRLPLPLDVDGQIIGAVSKRWPPERDAELKRLHSAGITPHHIAQQISGKSERAMTIRRRLLILAALGEIERSSIR